MGEYSKLQRAEEADAAATKCPDKFRPNVFEQQVCHRPLTPVDLADCSRFETSKRLSRPIYDFMMEVFEAKNESDLSVALKIKGTSRLGRGAPEMPYQFESQDSWTLHERFSDLDKDDPYYWHHLSFQRKCRHDNPRKSEDIALYISTEHTNGQHYLSLYAEGANEEGTKWYLSIETFAVTPIRKGAPSSIGQCHLPRSDEQGVFSMHLISTIFECKKLGFLIIACKS